MEYYFFSDMCLDLVTKAKLFRLFERSLKKSRVDRALKLTQYCNDVKFPFTEALGTCDLALRILELQK